ncbi:MAG: hypothetical protein P8Y48_02590 [Novosphingobium sp.]
MRLLALSGLFIGTTVFLLFLRETRIAAASLRIPRDYLELDRTI